MLRKHWELSQSMNVNGRDAAFHSPGTGIYASEQENTRLSQEVERLGTILSRREQQIAQLVRRLETFADNPAYLAKTFGEDVREAARSGDEAAGSLNDLLRYLWFTAEDFAESQNAVDAVHKSWSWKLTAPLRVLLESMWILWGLIRNGCRGLIQPAKIRGAFEWLRFRDRVRASGLFDDRYYLRSNPDVLRRKLSPLFHFFVFGAAEGRNPHFLFDVAYYCSENPARNRFCANPLVHYLDLGAYEGRDPHPLFDSSFYLEQNPDVREAGLNPLSHYLMAGIAEGRNPNACFGTPEYLDLHPDVAAYGLNPLIHSVDQGAERRWRVRHRAAGE